MPIYKNSTTSVITVGSIRVEPGQTVETGIFIPTANLGGLTLDSATHTFDPILQSNKVTSTSTVNILASLTGNYQVEIFCTTGEVGVQFNSASNILTLLGPNMKITRQCSERIINSLIFTISSGTAYVTVSKI